jgi:endonuclease/exonuclease/phosphatase family metal-dependent hydrolase
VKWAVLALIALWVLSAPSVEASGRTVRLATWNLHNYFDEFDNPAVKEPVFTHRQVEHKIDQLAGVVRRIQPDLIAVEEIENMGLLQRLAVRAGGFRYAVLTQGNDMFRGINVGLLSRVPLAGYKSHRKMVLHADGMPGERRFSRDCLEVHVQGPVPMTLLVNHLKSKLSGGRIADSKRRAQAEGVATIIDQLERKTPGLPLAVVGDFNDDLHSWALEPVRTCAWLHDPFGSMTLDKRCSFKFHGHELVIDYILLTDSLRTHLIEGSQTVHRGRDIEKASDHYPVSLDLHP